MHFYLVIVISAVVGITCVAGSSFIKARDVIVYELSDMNDNVNRHSYYFKKNIKDAKVRKTSENSADCEKAITSLWNLVYEYKKPSDIKDDELKTKAETAYNKCKTLMTALNALKAGEQITTPDKNTLTHNCQLLLNNLNGYTAMDRIVEKIHEYSLNSLAELNKLQIGKKFAEEKKKELKGYFQLVLDNLKSSDFENVEEFAIVKKVMELKHLS